MEVTQTILLSLSPRREEIAAIISFFTVHFEALNKLAGVSGRINTLHFRLALDEALLNACEHGCKNQPLGKISVFMRFQGDVVELSVEDPGLGFSYQDRRIDNEKSLEQIMMRGVKRAKGWGLAIIQTFCQYLYWNPRGNRITMVFLRRAAREKDQKP